MLCANYYTSVIKNLLPPTAGPPPLPSFSVCKLAKAKREIQEGMSLLACAICVCAKNAGRYRGRYEAWAGSVVRALSRGTLLLIYSRYSIVAAAVWSWALWEQVYVCKAACSPPARAGLSPPRASVAFSALLVFVLVLPEVAESLRRCFPSSHFWLWSLSLQPGRLLAAPLCPSHGVRRVQARGLRPYELSPSGCGDAGRFGGEQPVPNGPACL